MHSESTAPNVSPSQSNAIPDSDALYLDDNRGDDAVRLP